MKTGGLDRRQGHGAAGQRRVTLVNTMSGTRARPAGVDRQVRRAAGAHRRLAGAGGRQSDNIPGVPKCGPKTATKWLGEYGDLDTIKARADEVGGKVGEKPARHLDQLELSRELATIRCDVPLASARRISRGARRTPSGCARCTAARVQVCCCAFCGRRRAGKTRRRAAARHAGDPGRDEAEPRTDPRRDRSTRPS
jgi:hypothetical protein